MNDDTDSVCAQYLNRRTDSSQPVKKKKLLLLKSTVIHYKSSAFNRDDFQGDDVVNCKQCCWIQDVV